jgi:hypothetical protein
MTAKLTSRLKIALAASAVFALGACELLAPVTPVPVPPARPSGLGVQPPAAVVEQSKASRDLAVYYARLQNDLLAQGLMRTDGGGPDTSYKSADLIRNFEQVVFYDEYGPGGGLTASTQGPGKLRRWDAPVRIKTAFGPSVSAPNRLTFSDEVAGYTNRLARISGHPISTTGGKANFHVIFASSDDREAIAQTIRALRPDMQDSTLNLFLNPPRSTHCLVVAYANAVGSQTYGQAIALIRAEHPDQLRLSCIHEELAQGLGLANDSPAARPSIFNDDDEFSLLTSHDEMLLKMLYDPRLRSGMSATEARPVLEKIANELTGGV